MAYTRLLQTPFLATKTHSPTPRLPTPPSHPPICWPGITSSTPHPSMHPTLFNTPNTPPYSEPLAWSHSTPFHNPPNTESHPYLYRYPHINQAAALQNTKAKQYFRPPRHIRTPWHPKIHTRILPRTLALLLTLLLLSASSVATIFSARSVGATTWAIPAPVALSVFEMGAGVLTVSALVEGIVVAFWVGVGRGVTVAGVCEGYEGAFVCGALWRCVRCKGNRVAVGTVGAVISLCRGPMFQRGLVVVEGGVYEVDVVFVALGMVMSVVGVIAILPLYYGYWELGRDVSLNPVEIARAFGAPLFDGVDGNVTARDIEIEKGDLMVRYGAVERNGEERILRIEDTSKTNVRRPRDGEIFG